MADITSRELEMMPEDKKKDIMNILNRTMGKASRGYVAISKNIKTNLSAYTKIGKLQEAVDMLNEQGLGNLLYVSEEDAKTCAECGGMNGKILYMRNPTHHKFLPPLHPNCRCYILPYTELFEWWNINRYYDLYKPPVKLPDTPSDDIIAFIKIYEGFRSMPYRGGDKQNRTVGYGHKIFR